MAGWENSNENIYVEKVEEILDTNPDLYKQRTIAALNDELYTEALKEVNFALKYGNKKMEYRVLKVRVLLEMQNYRECYAYLKQSELLNVIYKKVIFDELLLDEVNYIYYAFGICTKQLTFDITKSDIVIVTPDGKGMYKTIQQAIDKCTSSQKIYITNGDYEEDINIVNKTVNIAGTIYGNKKGEETAIHGSVKIRDAYTSINNITFVMGMHSIKAVVDIENSKVTMDNCRVCGKEMISGIYSYNMSEIRLLNCIIKYCLDGVIKELGKGTLKIHKGIFERCKTGVVATDRTYIGESTFSHMKESCVAVVRSKKEGVELENCELLDSHIGIKIVEAVVYMNSCIISKNTTNILILDECILNVIDTSIRWAKYFAFQVVCSAQEKRNIKKDYKVFWEFKNVTIENNSAEIYVNGVELCKKEQNVIRQNNDVLSAVTDRVKNFLNKWL